MVGLTRPVAAARAVLLQRERRVKLTRHVSDTWKCGSSSFIFTHPPEDEKKKKKKKEEGGIAMVEDGAPPVRKSFSPPKNVLKYKDLLYMNSQSKRSLYCGPERSVLIFHV